MGGESIDRMAQHRLASDTAILLWPALLNASANAASRSDDERGISILVLFLHRDLIESSEMPGEITVVALKLQALLHQLENAC